MEYQLELDDVAKSFKGFVAVDGVNLQISKGEIVSFLGASGCGKTTTLRMVAGLVAPTKGTIRIQGQDMKGIPPHKRDLSMVFQNYALFPHMTVYDNIVYGLKMRKIKDSKILKEKSDKMLEIVQLTGLAHRYPKELSGGQQQRVSLARAMIVEPKVMLFDEPLSNLDAKLREKTRVEIRNLLKSMEITAIYVTHDQEEALTISDRIAVMNKGKIEQITTPMELYKAPITKFIAGFVGHANFFEGTVRHIEGPHLVLVSQEDQVIHANFEGPQNLAEGQTVTLAIRPENIMLSAVNTGEKNTFAGQIKARIYLGATVRYLINLWDDARIEVDLHNEELDCFQEGSTVFITLDANNLILLEK